MCAERAVAQVAAEASGEREMKLEARVTLLAQQLENRAAQVTQLTQQLEEQLEDSAAQETQLRQQLQHCHAREVKQDLALAALRLEKRKSRLAL